MRSSYVYTSNEYLLFLRGLIEMNAKEFSFLFANPSIHATP